MLLQNRQQVHVACCLTIIKKGWWYAILGGEILRFAGQVIMDRRPGGHPDPEIVVEEEEEEVVVHEYKEMRHYMAKSG